MACLALKQQPMIRAIRLAGVSALGAHLRGMRGIDLDRHTPMQEGFISHHALQLGKGPLRISSIGFALLVRGTLSFGPPRTLSDIG